MSIKFDISAVGFGWLSQAFEEKNIISPFSVYERYAGDFDEKTKNELIHQSVIGEDGTIEPEALGAFNVLSKADAYSRIRILGTNAPVEKVTYFRDDDICSLDSGSNGFTVSFPALTKEAGFTLEEFSGSSRFVNVPFSKTLTKKAAILFLSIVDLSRAAALHTIAGDPKPIYFSIEDIIKGTKPNDTYMWFVKTLNNLVGEELLSEADICASLKELAEKKLTKENEGKYCLVDDALEMANSQMIPEYVFNISSGRMLSLSEAEHSECYVIFCGMHDLLYIEVVDGSVIIETISGNELFEILINSINISPTKNKKK